MYKDKANKTMHNIGNLRYMFSITITSLLLTSVVFKSPYFVYSTLDTQQKKGLISSKFNIPNMKRRRLAVLNNKTAMLKDNTRLIVTHF